MKARLDFTTSLEDYLAAVVRAGEDINKVSREALAEAGEILHAEMVRRVPVDEESQEEHLRDKIEIRTPTGEGDFNYVEVGIVNPDKLTAIRAMAVEFGTVYQPAQSYIRTAVRAKRGAIQRLIRERLKSAGMVD